METVEIKRHRHGIFWPVLLITTGVVLLLNTMGVIQRNPWELLFSLWPLLFILGGLDHIFRGEGWVWGLVSIALGSAFLAANFGYLPWNSLNLLLQLWPLLLIAVGLDLIFKDRSPVVTIFGALVAVVMIGLMVWYFFLNGSAVKTIITPVKQEIGAINSANVRLANAVGLIELSAGAADGVLIEGDTAQISNEEAASRYEAVDKVGSYSLSNTNVIVMPFSGNFNQPKWDLKLTKEIPILLETSTGAGRQTLDLSGMNLETLNATVALGDLFVTLPKNDTFEGEINNPIGSIRILVPQGALVEFSLDTAITTQNIGAEFTSAGDTVYSPGANAENATMRLSIDQPIGRLSIEMMP